MKFEHSYQNLPSSFYSVSKPALFANPELIVFNENLANELQFDHKAYDRSDLGMIFSGQKTLAGSNYSSLAYAGHQFAHFVPILGDGRAMLLGEVKSKSGIKYDVQLKGAGPTEFSRRGDGFSALGPVLREYLVSEFMHRMGVPTTRALAAVKTNHHVARETMLAGGVLTRVAQSHLRIGSFQYFLGRNDIQGLKSLFEFTLDRHYKEISNDHKELEDRALIFLEKVIEAQFSLIAQWMSLGFIHGVMNTDNTSISGETIDYGPCAFMDYFDFNQVYSYIDRQGRYAFGNQPKIITWNLSRLADCLVPLLTLNNRFNQKTAVAKLSSILQTKAPTFGDHYNKMMNKKIAIEDFPLDLQERLSGKLQGLLSDHQLDFTTTYRKLADQLIQNEMILDEQLVPFFNEWKNELRKEGLNLTTINQKMNSINPTYIPRNHLIEKAIDLAYQNDFSFYYNLLSILSEPFTEKEEYITFAQPPTPNEVVTNTFCGT